MQVIVQVSAELAGGGHQRSRAPMALDNLYKVVETFGLNLEPLHPGTDHPLLQGFYSVEVPDDATGLRLVDRLKLSEGVEAAYLKPPDGLP